MSEVKKHRKDRSYLYLLLIVALIFSLIVIFGLYSRKKHTEDVQKWTETNRIPVVRLVTAESLTSENKLTLPGRVEAINKASIYSRVNGYLRVWYKDIGANVHKGDLLAEIETPELDHQLDQAKADLASAVQSKKLADITRKRWESLVETDAVSKQAADEKISDATSKLAYVKSLQARVKTLESMVAFKKVTSPFDGKVISRSTDIGSLINAASNGGEASAPLFTIADIQKLRVYVNVPQQYADKLVKLGSANLVVPEYADRNFKLAINGISGAVNEQSGSVLVQFELDNKERLLNPGSYGQVEIQLPTDASLRKLPVSAIMIRNQGIQVATVDSTHHVKIKAIKTGNDYGSYVEVLSGLTSEDQIIDSPPDLIEDGQLVKLTSSNQKAAVKVSN